LNICPHIWKQFGGPSPLRSGWVYLCLSIRGSISEILVTLAVPPVPIAAVLAPGGAFRCRKSVIFFMT
jgi:hypothetical protein